MIRINKDEYMYLKKLFPDNMFKITVHNRFIVEEHDVVQKLIKIREDGIENVRR